MNRLLSFFLVLVLAIPVAYLTWPAQPALTLTTGKTNKTVYAEPINVGERFIIQFTHSIHKTPVVEEYFIDTGYNIVLDQVTFETYGVGNPSSIESGQTFTQKDGKYIIGNMNRVLPYFDQAIGQVIANHQLIIKNEQIAFSELSQPGSWVRIEVKKVSLFTIWKGRSSIDQ
jgi:hypothetical protein